MSIVLVTGTPGAGKTLYTVKMLIEDLLPTGRQIFCNIAGLNIDAENLHICDDTTPLDWMDFPNGSIFIFDEVQRQYPPRNTMAKVPPHIQAFETHRHHGFDFYLITQGPRLIDRHLHDLVERHVHLYRAFGLSRSSIFEWNGINLQPNPAQTRLTAQRKNFMFPKKYFKSYKSSSDHTIKARPPWRLLVILGVCLFAIVGCGWYVLHTISPERVAERTAELTTEGLEGSETGYVPELQQRCSVRVSGRAGGFLLLTLANGQTLRAHPTSIQPSKLGPPVFILGDRAFFVCV